MKIDSLEIRRPDNGHCHLREDEMMELVFRFSAIFGRAIIEPNLKMPRVSTPQHLNDYRQEIYRVRHRKGFDHFQPRMNFRITPETTPLMIHQFKKARAIAGKLYPEGVTTGSDQASGGVTDFEALYPVFGAMAEVDLPVRFHAEMPKVHPLQAEQQFIPVLRAIIKRFPTLRVVVEHLSSAEMFEFVKSAKMAGARIGATITPHHLVLTQADVYIGDVVAYPHNFCKPVAKTAEDRDCLIKAATAGYDWIWLGTDTAPHDKALKERPVNPMAGVFCEPVAMPVYTQVFEAADALSRLDPFASHNLAAFYGLRPNNGRMLLVRKPCQVPLQIGNVVPFLAGQTTEWQVF